MIVFQFETTFTHVRVVSVKKGKIFHPVNGWVDIPASGEPLSEHLYTPERFAPKGSLSEICELGINADPRDMEGSGIAVYSSDASGGSLKRQVYWSLDYALQAVRFVGPGFCSIR